MTRDEIQWATRSRNLNMVLSPYPRAPSHASHKYCLAFSRASRFKIGVSPNSYLEVDTKYVMKM